MNNQTCETCVHFHQHYSLKDGKVTRVFCGHCTFKSPKTKRPYAKACENYAYGPDDTDAFATKKYLTKELLQYLLHLELLPPVADSPTGDS